MSFWNNGDIVFCNARWEKVGKRSHEIVDLYYIDNDTLSKKTCEEYSFTDEQKRQFKKWLASVGYTKPSISPKLVINTILDPCVGSSLAAMDAHASSVIKSILRRRTSREEARGHWEIQDDEFKAHVIGLDQDADTTKAGMSMRLLLNTSKTHTEHRDFLARRKLDVLHWAMEETAYCDRIVENIGSIRFFKPVGMTLLNIPPEIEIQFVAKPAAAV